MAIFLVLVPAKPYLSVSEFWSYSVLQVSIVDEQIEDNLFCMLDEETDKEYVKKTFHNCWLSFLVLIGYIKT